MEGVETVLSRLGANTSITKEQERAARKLQGLRGLVSRAADQNEAVYRKPYSRIPVCFKIGP